MFYHQTNFTLFLCTCLLLACTKEKILKKNEWLDIGQIFMAGYVNNIPGRTSPDSIFINNLGISILGKDLPDKGIALYIDSGTGFQKQRIKYKPKKFQYDCDISLYRFIPNKKYTFKLISTALQDSLIIEKYLPNAFQLQTKLTYPNTHEYYASLKIMDNEPSDDFVYDIEDDNSSNGITYLYSASQLPHVYKPYDPIQSLSDRVLLNGQNIKDELRMPYLYPDCYYFPYRNYNHNRTYNLKYEIYKFYKEDFEFMNAMNNNSINGGNPFYSFYPSKHITSSGKGKIMGYMVAPNVQRSALIQIKDTSKRMIKVFIKDSNGNDIIDNPNYFITMIQTNKDLELTMEKGLNYFYLSENNLIITLNINNSIYCPYSYELNKNTIVRFKFRVRTITATYETESISTTLDNLPKDMIFTFQ